MRGSFWQGTYLDGDDLPIPRELQVVSLHALFCVFLVGGGLLKHVFRTTCNT